MPEVCYPLDGIAVPGSFGAIRAEAPGVELTVRRGLAMCQLMARMGQSQALAERFGIVGTAGQSTTTHDFVALPLAPGRWMLISERGGRDGAFTRQIGATASGLGYASEQSHGRQSIRLSGPAARDVMAKACRLDLDPSVTGPGFVAQTQMVGIGVLIHMVDETPTYDLLVFSGFAEDFWTWATGAAGEFGYRVI